MTEITARLPGNILCPEVQSGCCNQHLLDLKVEQVSDAFKKECNKLKEDL
jgi:hypothetical protein